MSEAQTEFQEAEIVDVVQEEERRGELIKFVLLVIVMLGTILVIALLRPYIFGQVVPSILGEGQAIPADVPDTTDAPETDENGTGTGGQMDEAADEETDEGTGEESDEETDETSAEEANENTAAEPTEPEKPEDFPTAVPARTHIVQPGETLTKIARQYNVTVNAIVAANNIPNPNRVAVGAVLVIPDP